MLAVDDKNDYFGFKSNIGGLFNFDGVIANSKLIDNININNNKNKVTVTYEDENVYTVSANIQETDNGKQITDITYKWNNQDIVENSAIEGILAMLLLGSNSDNLNHPDILEYIDNDPDYEIPETITPAENETFDSVRETWMASGRTVTWGIGIINKGEQSEAVSRMVYPDGTQISLINFNGEGGLG